MPLPTLMPAGRCYAPRSAEGQEDWATAEQWVQRAAERYTDSSHAWFYCVSGQIMATCRPHKPLVEKHLKSIGTPRTDSDFCLAAVLNAVTGQREKSPGLLLAAFAINRADTFALAAAMEHDSLGEDSQEG